MGSYSLERPRAVEAFHGAVLLALMTTGAAVLLPAGVSRGFSLMAAPAGAAVAAVIGAALALTGRGSQLLARRSVREHLEPAHAILALLPLIPISNYALLNQDLLSLAGNIFFLLPNAILAIGLATVVPSLLSPFVSRRTSLSVGLGLGYLYCMMPTLTRQNAWVEEGSFLTQVTVFGLVAGILFASYAARTQVVYPLVILLFAGNAAYTLWSRSLDMPPDPRAEWAFEAQLGQRPPVRTPDVYLLTYDSYVANELMQEYGLDNHEQEEWLIERGFTIYRNTYSIGPGSKRSMSAMFGLVSEYSYVDRTRVTAGNSAVLRTLKRSGYRTYSVVNPFFRGPFESQFDEPFFQEDAWGSKLLLEALAAGRFRFDQQWVGLDHGLEVDAKRQVMAMTAGPPRFLWNHTGPHHSQRSGRCLPDETERYASRLETANEEMRGDVAAATDSGRTSIIVIHGDHGPFLRGDCAARLAGDPGGVHAADMRDAFGAFLAIRWPEDHEQSGLKIVQDTFPAVFSHIFDDPEVMEHRLPPVVPELSLLRGVGIDDGLITAGPDEGKLLFPPSGSPETPEL